MTATLDRVIEITSRMTGVKAAKLNANSAIDQDIRIYGDDVTDLAEALAAEFGDQVWQWPWQRFAELNEGLSLLFPFMLVWQLLTWPVRGTFEYPSQFERLELGHIAKVIDAGQWLEP
ncbi:MAG: hypothetical protein KGZ65_07215 [Sphingomonadales bacterium]|nr:hypothetical protein [Sphingomonadaceae bacterium]MBS3931009.1 hypothetical protein [Sphingomonadales bacterium]